MVFLWKRGGGWERTGVSCSSVQLQNSLQAKCFFLCSSFPISSFSKPKPFDLGLQCWLSIGLPRSEFPHQSLSSYSVSSDALDTDGPPLPSPSTAGTSTYRLKMIPGLLHWPFPSLVTGCSRRFFIRNNLNLSWTSKFCPSHSVHFDTKIPSGVQVTFFLALILLLGRKVGPAWKD